MPASITLSNLTASTPEGRTLFSGLDLHLEAERAGLVGRNGVGKSTLLKLITGEWPAAAGRVLVSGTWGELRQLARVAEGETVADLFGANEALALLRRAEAGEASVDDLARADWTLESRMAAALGRVGLAAEPQTPLSRLSGGQRTRAGLAALVFDAPDFLLLDEPTNNLDRDGRRAVIELIAGWRGGALVVSHDRELLEAVDAIVELTSLGAARYGGNGSHYRERKALELAAAEHDLATAQKQRDEAARSAQLTAERKARRDGAGRRKRARGDAPKILLDRKKERSEATSGGNARLAEARRGRADASLAAARERLEVIEPLAVSLAPTGLPAGRTVLQLAGVTAGYTPEQAVIKNLSLTLTGPERVAVTGPNGAGKSTLLALVTGRLAPWAGSIEVLDFALLDQRLELLDPAASIRDNFRRLNPADDENACRAVLARFGFRAGDALQCVASLSGGQLLRAGLACAVGGGHPPPLLILDEPTNHLDLEAIEAVEAGLRAYDGALLVVSHDEAFLAAIGIERRVEIVGGGISL